MDGQTLIKKLTKRIASWSGKHTLEPAELAKALGVAQQTITNWQHNNELGAAAVANVFIKALDVARAKFELEAIKPVVEFFKFEPVKSLHGAKLELFSSVGDSGDAHPYRKGLRNKLEKAHGIYIFYDSRGRALYSGKAKKLTLWKEMNDALNRPRDVQRVFRVFHPGTQVPFRESSEKFRQISSQSVKLYDMAEYVSAYEVAVGLIDTIESILIRSFPNDLLNVKMEKFGGGPQTVKRKAVKKRKKKASAS